MKLFADYEKLDLSLLDEYGLGLFLSEVSALNAQYEQHAESSPNIKRCAKCCRMRMEKTASFAKKNGFTSFSTTLLISPYQNHDEIKKTAEEMAERYRIDFFYRDFRPLFREGQVTARAAGMYMQKYCGCIFSEEERYLKKKNEKAEIISHIKRQSQIPQSYFDRLTLLTGKDGFEKLKSSSALVFGLGGVGSWTAEALVRSGIGKIGIIDNDIICPSNVNRQVQATSLTLGLPKAACLKKRLLEINPECEITAFDEIFCLETAEDFNIKNTDYIIDAIDSINHKLDLIETAVNSKATLFSSMGMALKMDPSKIKTASIWKTDICPLARFVRQGLRKRKFSGDFTAVYSCEQIEANHSRMQIVKEGQKTVNGSIVTVTASTGFLLASLVLRDILGGAENEQIFKAY